jgi:hypothetical protein
MVFVAVGKHIFTYPTAALAQTDFAEIRTEASLYRLDLDLSRARLVEQGDGQEAPGEFEPTEKQKQLLYKAFVYKSLLEWAPEHDENMP